MAVDYDAHYGIGFEIDVPDKDSEYAKKLRTSDYQNTSVGVRCDLIDHLDEHLKGSGYKYFSVGEGAYTGAIDPIYVVIDSPFLEISKDLADAEKRLTEYLKNIDVHTKSVFDLHGGLEVW